MTSTSPSGRNNDSTGKHRRRVKQQNMSVADRLKMAQRSQIHVRTDYEEDEHEDEDGYGAVEDGVIDQRKMERAMSIGEVDKSTLRIVAQFLDSIGLKETVNKLVEESGCTVENSHGAKLRTCILKGNYHSAYKVLEKCTPNHLDPKKTELTKFLMKCFEVTDMIRKQRYFDAVFCLREISTTTESMTKPKMDVTISLLKELLISKPRSDGKLPSDIRKSQLGLIEELLPPNFILPQDRLRNLLNGVTGQSPAEKSRMILNDKKVPTSLDTRVHRCVQILKNHHDEVWVVKFSRDGTLLASGGKCNDVVIWKVKNGRLAREGILAPIVTTSHNIGVGCLEFSPNNKYIGMCGTLIDTYCLTIFNVDDRTIYRTIRVNNSFDDVHEVNGYFNCFSWFGTPGMQTLVAGSECGTMKVYNMDYSENAPPIKSISGFRVRNLYAFKDGARFITSDSQNRVMLFNIQTDEELVLFQEEGATIVTFTVHPSERLVLTTTNLNLRLWDIKSRSLIRYFSGACHQDAKKQCFIHSTFGGASMGFIATGTVGGESDESLPNQTGTDRKNGKICIWNLENCRPILTLKGHKDQVNAVTWNPKNPTMFVSGSDDNSVRVWSIDKSFTDVYSDVVPPMMKRSEKKSNQRKKANGIGYKNGGSMDDGCIASSSVQQQVRIDRPFEEDLQYEEELMAKLKSS